MDFEEFLRGRGLDESLLKKLRDDKIDPDTVLLMTENDLTTYFPIYGDRLAIVNFCKHFSKKNENKSRKAKAISALRKTLGMSRKRKDGDSSESDDEVYKKNSMQRIGNKNAVKPTKVIEIGWINKDATDLSYSQVRKKNGGSTRKVTVRKECVKKDILEIGKQLFFPNGISKKGPEDKFDFDITDFQENKFSDTETVLQISERTKMSLLRFYLATSEKSSNSMTCSNISENEIQQNVYQKNKQLINLTADPVHDRKSSDSCSSLPELYEGHHEIRQENTALWTPSAPYTLTQPQPSPDDTIQFGPVEHQDEDLSETLPLFEPSTSEYQELIIRRGFALDEMIFAFENDLSLGRTHSFLHVKRLLPNGEMETADDLGGVLKDTLTEFWSTFYERCTLGTNVKVPFLRHDFNYEKWDAVGRILKLGYLQTKYFPILLAPTFLRQIILGTAVTSAQNDDQILKDYLRFLSVSERETIQSALDDFDGTDIDDILEIFDEHKARQRPTKSNIKKIVLELAVKELIQEPMFVIDIWVPHFTDLQIKTTDIDSLYKKCIPVSRSVIQLLEFPDAMTEAQKDTSKYLKKFLLELEPSMLGTFLRFATGADIITTVKIKIDFNSSLVGMAKRIIAHTCSSSLELPEAYESYPDFRSQFMGILSSKIWVMDMI